MFWTNDLGKQIHWSELKDGDKIKTGKTFSRIAYCYLRTVLRSCLDEGGRNKRFLFPPFCPSSIERGRV
jgi:hypothetical protein